VCRPSIVKHERNCPPVCSERRATRSTTRTRAGTASLLVVGRAKMAATSPTRAATQLIGAVYAGLCFCGEVGRPKPESDLPGGQRILQRGRGCRERMLDRYRPQVWGGRNLRSRVVGGLVPRKARLGRRLEPRYAKLRRRTSLPPRHGCKRMSTRSQQSTSLAQ
jgi:hypothetical protein